MASKTQIVNIALARIGASKQVANVDTESSREAVTARTFFDDDVLYVLRDFPWPWARCVRRPRARRRQQHGEGQQRLAI
jgi:hypothetical protein